MKQVFIILSLFAISSLGLASEDNINVLLEATFGNQNIEPSITNGTRATLGQFPYQVAITMTIAGAQAVCGGSLIRHRWVMTSAHCLLPIYSNFRVTFAALNALTGPNEWRSGILTRDDIVLHPDFNFATFLNNIGLIHVHNMPETLTNSPNVGIIERPNESEASLNLVGRVGTTSGYGRTSDEIVQWDPILYYTSHTIVANTVCSEFYGNIITNRNLCVDTTTGGSPCGSDAGGPMTIEVTPQRRILVGIVSATPANCTHGYPAIYESVLFHREWIERTMNGSSMIGVSFAVIAAAIMMAVKNSM